MVARSILACPCWRNGRHNGSNTPSIAGSTAPSMAQHRAWHGLDTLPTVAGYIARNVAQRCRVGGGRRFTAGCGLTGMAGKWLDNRNLICLKQLLPVCWPVTSIRPCHKATSMRETHCKSLSDGLPVDNSEAIASRLLVFC